ncbi:MAG TPA: sugar phosphate nucleotidyltransferase [Gaiellaceae bacterium]|nr:sugar phosphate nucleotidyltransferase [Gaiellaceae bacterium]
MKGVVLAAGPGRRLGALTRDLPKTLLPLGEAGTILDLVLANLASAGIDEVVVVTGFAAERVDEVVPALEERHGLRVEALLNERAVEWNNAHSLWLAREAFADGALVVNGDTVHPRSVEEALLAAAGDDVLLAVDEARPPGPEAMKVVLDGGGRLERIGKELDPADGEYIGVALVGAAAAEALADALEATWRRDPSLYYEDGFQELVDRGGGVRAAAIGTADWVEVDDDADLARAREIACRF